MKSTLHLAFGLFLLVNLGACAKSSLPAPTVQTTAQQNTQAVAPLAAGEPTEQCLQYSTPVNYNVCIYKTPGSTNPDVLYYLHGLTGNEHMWLLTQVYKNARALWAKKNVQAPTVIGVSFGPQWLLTDKTTVAGSGLYPIFVSDVMPTIEKALGGLQGQRLLLGESMGGFNATELFLKSGSLFDRVMLACPALALLTPFSTTDEINAYTLRTHADALHVALLMNLVNYFFKTPDGSAAAWNTASPFALGERNLSSASPRLHVSCGDTDEFGFFEGAQAFANLAQSKGVDTTWALLHGGHCTVDPQAVADFLSR